MLVSETHRSHPSDKIKIRATLEEKFANLFDQSHYTTFFMISRIIAKLKTVYKSVLKTNAIHDEVKEIRAYLKKIDNSQQEQQLKLEQQAAQNNIHTYANDPVPTFEGVTSQLCTFQQMLHPNYIQCIKTLFHPPFPIHSYTRKYWEFCYVLQAVSEKGALKEGNTGLGFGVGLEPLSAAFVNKGCRITATDLALDEAIEKGWAGADSMTQHSQQLEDMNKAGICDPETFRKNCSFRVVDMNHIPNDLQDFDFTWSSCCLEHLGSIEAGLQFVKNSLKCLKSGGIAVHTTEFNLSSAVETVDNHDTVLFRKLDILRLISDLETEGHTVSPVTFNSGIQPEDCYVDVPPYFKHDFHLKLLLGKYVTTSIGIIIQKA